MTIDNNQVNDYDGGALMIWYDFGVTFEGNSTVKININQADYDGGALYIADSSDATFEGNSTVMINNNQATYRVEHFTLHSTLKLYLKETL